MADAADEDDEQVSKILDGRLLYTKRSDPSIATLVKRYKKQRIDPQPEFQRYEVWNEKKKSRLIESILLGLPIPLFYLAEEEDGSVVVVDGQQRLMSVFRYIDNEYPLKDLGPLKDELEGKHFKELPDDIQDALEEAEFSTVTILSESESRVRFDMFERLNSGATGLNAQEIRNCEFRGPYNRYVIDLANGAKFRSILRISEPHKRMVDVELVLRFLAFHHQGFHNHDDKRTNEFLNRQMRLAAAYKANERQAAAKAFKDATELSVSLFGEHACRRFAAGDATNPNGGWEKRVNRAVMDVQLWGFTQYQKSVVMANLDDLRERLLRLMVDPDFADLVTHTISQKQRVIRRFEAWKSAMDEVLAGKKGGPRLFPYSKKGGLFKADPTCAICDNQIQILDDAEVDHVVPVSAGGATDGANAQLAHRYCNRAKGGSTTGS